MKFFSFGKTAGSALLSENFAYQLSEILERVDVILHNQTSQLMFNQTVVRGDALYLSLKR